MIKFVDVHLDGLEFADNLESENDEESIQILKADFLSWQKLLATIFFQKKSVK